jgi:hypothetical protein
MTHISNSKLLFLRNGLLLLIWCSSGFPPLHGQAASAKPPTLNAIAKGPNQINLTWPAVSDPGYGYLVEIQSAADSRYSSWTELQPIAKAGGYTCDPTVVWNGGKCTISDPSGTHVYNPPHNAVPYWVTDPTYIDPLDDSPAQFIAWGLKPNTGYSFRVRSYSGSSRAEDEPPPKQAKKSARKTAASNSARRAPFGPYSNTATATTANYALRYVSPAGNDSNDGSSAARAWRTLKHGSSAIGCGQALLVMGGSYASDGISMGMNCSSDRRAVVMAVPGEKPVITSNNMSNAISLPGSYIVIDGITSASSTKHLTPEYAGIINGHHNALLNVEIHPSVVPSFSQHGVIIYGGHNLLYRSYVHDIGSPDATQNPNGNSGYALTVLGTGGTHNVIWSNHLTRGAHDTSLCKSGCSYNRWQNNVIDGGWGIGWAAVGGAGPDVVTGHNLVEGNFFKDVGRLVSAYKPSIEVSYGFNTVRRNIAVNCASTDLELSALYGGDTAAKILVYNNTFYKPGRCIFQSRNGGAAAYDHDLYANNICYKARIDATDIYLANKTARIINNSITFADAQGKLQPDQAMVTWNHEAQGPYQYPVPLARADAEYNPPFANNKHLSVDPKFVDEEHFDFALQPASRLLGAGTPITDPEWGSSAGKVDLGAFGLQLGAEPGSLARPAPKPRP